MEKTRGTSVKAVHADGAGVVPQPCALTDSRGRWFALFWLLFICPLSLALSEEISSRDSKPLPLTNIEQVREITRQQAALKPEVFRHAVVTFFDPPNVGPFIQDATAGVFVDMGAEPTPDLKVGDWVEVRGVAQWIDFAPDVGSPRFRVLGHAPLPTAPKASFSQLTSTNNNSPIRMQGLHACSPDLLHSVLLRRGTTMRPGRNRPPGTHLSTIITSRPVKQIKNVAFHAAWTLRMIWRSRPCLAWIQQPDCGLCSSLHKAPRLPCAGAPLILSVCLLLRPLPQGSR